MCSSFMLSPLTCRTNTSLERVMPPEQPSGRQHIDRTAAVVVPLEQAFFFEVSDVFVHGGQGTQAHPGANFFERGRVSMPLHKVVDEVVNLSLTFCNSHQRNF